MSTEKEIGLRINDYISQLDFIATKMEELIREYKDTYRKTEALIDTLEEMEKKNDIKH